MTFYTRAMLEHFGVLEPARPQNLSERSGTVVGITDHWEAGEEAATSFERLHDIQQQYFAKGYGDTPYNGAYDGAGDLFDLRAVHWTGAHASSPNNEANETTVGVCYLEPPGGGLTTPALHAWAACRGLYRLQYGHQPEGFAHSYWARLNGQGTACPGPLIPLIAALGGKV